MLYVYEPSIWRRPEHDASHLRFVNECLVELDAELARRGARLLTRVGEMPEVLSALHRELGPSGGIEALWSHEETGLAVTYGRDIRVRVWCRAAGVPWYESPQNGVVRGLRDRDGWAAQWAERMGEPCATPPRGIRCVSREMRALDPGRLFSPEELGIEESGKREVQRGGRAAGADLLESFLARRGENYRADMASPVTGEAGCSRLSPYLAWGALSVREVFQRTRVREDELRGVDPKARGPRWLPSLASFRARLHWHCHFMQKLEKEPEIEFLCMNRAFEGMRDPIPDEARFEAWKRGETGFPMVDAVMRCLHATGWVNFRMRAMLVSFASHHLWLHWRPTSVFLARHFLDFEPGIHFCQFQMQSGVTGINTLRIYSPAKQAQDQDPEGVFIRRWVPELAGLPAEHLAAPEAMPPLLQRSLGCVIGRDYPAPIVDHKRAYREARDRVWRVRKTEFAKKEAERVYREHGSRKKQPRRQGRRRTGRQAS